jgi:hypothetical protein
LDVEIMNEFGFAAAQIEASFTMTGDMRDAKDTRLG